MDPRPAIVAQFRRPHGLMGRLAGAVMAHRPSNRVRNLWTVDLLDLRPDHRVLEIGCGPGVALAACLARLRSGLVVGIDHSAAMIAQARRRLDGAIDDGRLALHEGGLALLAELEGSFDRIFSVNVVQFFPDMSEAYREIFMATSPGGRVATTYMPRGRRPSRDDALRMADPVWEAMTAAGFAGLRTEELPLAPAPAMCVLGDRPAEVPTR